MKNILIIIFTLISVSAFSQGFPKTTQPDTLTNAFTIFQTDYGTMGVWLDSLLNSNSTADGNGIFTATNDTDTSRIDSIYLTQKLQFIGENTFGITGMKIPGGDNAGGGGFYQNGNIVWAQADKAYLGGSDSNKGYIQTDTFGVVKLQGTDVVIQGKPLLSTEGAFSITDANADDTIRVKSPAVLTSSYTLEYPVAQTAGNGYVRTYNTDGTSQFVDPVSINGVQTDTIISGTWNPTITFNLNDTLVSVLYATYHRLDSIVTFELKVKVAMEALTASYQNANIKFTLPTEVYGTPGESSINTTMNFYPYQSLNLGDDTSIRSASSFVGSLAAVSYHLSRTAPTNFNYPDNRMIFSVSGSYKIFN